MSGYNSVNKIFYVDSHLYDGHYNHIKDNLKNYLIKIGEELTWTLHLEEINKITFKSKFEMFTVIEEIEVNFGKREIKISSSSIQSTIWNSKQKNKNEKNCNDYIEKIPEVIKKYLESDIEKLRLQKIEEERQNEINRIETLNFNKNSIINQLDKDNNGEVDLLEGDSFNKLLNKNQKIIIDIDKNYIQKFVKITIYLKTKKNNTQKIFESIRVTKNENELNELVSLLKNQIHTYELLVFHSISMITSLVQGDLISFYEIYECFDQLGVFNSNWENEVSTKLLNIGDGIKDLMYSIYHMEQSIVNSLENLSYITQDSFVDLKSSIDSQLSSIDSSIQCNNLLTGIQTYQMYKVNQNTKRIN
jgi:hypothetical protein